MSSTEKMLSRAFENSINFQEEKQQQPLVIVNSSSTSSLSSMMQQSSICGPGKATEALARHYKNRANKRISESSSRYTSEESNSDSQASSPATPRRTSSSAEQTQRKLNRPALALSGDTAAGIAATRAMLQKMLDDRPRMMSCGETRVHRSEAEVVALVARFIEETVNKTDNSIEMKTYKGDIFCGSSQPRITIQGYLERLFHYLTGLAQFERSSGHDRFIRSDLALRYIVMTIIYLEKISATSSILVSSRNIHRLIITGIMIASKVVDDVQPSNAYFAQLGGIQVKEINILETEFCKLLNFSLFVRSDDFDIHYAKILSLAPMNILHNRKTSAAAAAA